MKKNKKETGNGERGLQLSTADLLPVPPQSRLQGSHGEIAMATTPTWEHLLT